MIPLQTAKHNYLNFDLESAKHPNLKNCIDEQFKDCLLANSLGCQIPRDVLPFKSKGIKRERYHV